MNFHHPDTVNSTGNGPANSIHGQLTRRLALVVLFAVVLLGCRWLAYQLRFDFQVPAQYEKQMQTHWHWVLGLQLLCLFMAGQFSGIYRYFSLPDIQRLFAAFFASGALLFGIHYSGFIGYGSSRGVILLQAILGFLALGCIRTGWRVVAESYLSPKSRLCSKERKVAIIGAGDAGARLICDLRAHPRLGLTPVAFFDDDPQKFKSYVHGVQVVGSIETIKRFSQKFEFEEAIIAMPSAPPKRLAEIVDLLRKAGTRCVTVPGLHQLTSGNFSISQVRPVKIEDLLGREPVDLRLDEIGRVLRERAVMVTGAGGSIGSELCRQVASFHPKQLLLVEQSEVQLFQIEQELIKLGHGDIVKPLIGDILDQPRLRAIFHEYRPAVIFHAAAHKHVFMMETQPSEAIKNNALGTARLAELALEFGVERFVLISTDKAVNPTSVMGASKRLAELFVQAFAAEHPNKTRFVAVRFGNVLGSSGSVVPIFERQIADGGPVTVTHPDVVRFFMTIPEAVGLVLQSCSQGSGGEIFVLDMGKPVKIADLARQMITLSGLEPDRDIEIKYVGLRPGEKLYEELQHLQANCTETAHPRIKRLTSPPESLQKVRGYLAQFNGDLHSATADQFKLMLKSMLPEYMPHLGGTSVGGESVRSGLVPEPPRKAPHRSFIKTQFALKSNAAPGSLSAEPAPRSICAVKDQVTCDLSGEAVILQLQDGMYYGLDPVGASIWKFIQTPKTITEVRDAIVEEYDVTPEQCEADLRALLAEMKEQRLVTVEEGGN